MKKTIYWLTTELDNCGTDTTLYATESAQREALYELMRDRVEHVLKHCLPQYGFAETHAAAAQCKALMDEGTAEAMEEAFEIYRGDDGEPVQDQDDYYWWGEQTLELVDDPTATGASIERAFNMPGEVGEFATGAEEKPEPLLRVFYVCPECGNEWHEEYTCACDSECDCGAENIEAVSWEEI